MNLNQKLILSLSLGYVILNTFISTNNTSDFNPSYNLVQSALTLHGRARNRLSKNIANISPPQAVEQNINKQEIFKKHFPDWEERMGYQKK